MNTSEQAALEGLAGRSLSADDVAALGPLVQARNDVEIAALLSAGRSVVMPRTVTARGIRAAVPIVAAVPFLALLREAAASSTVPAWLASALTAGGVPEEDYPAYLDTVACAHAWLQQEGGIDLGSSTTRAMLDLIAASDRSKFGATVTTLKALAERPAPIHFNEVSTVLNKAQGLMTL